MLLITIQDIFFPILQILNGVGFLHEYVLKMLIL